MHPSDPLQLLKHLQAYQLQRVPFESLALHYTTHRQISIDLEDLFEKIVLQGKGGYCLELNTYFSAILRGLGFSVLNGAGRVKKGERWSGLTHMVNIVTISGQKYLVDVGYGANGCFQPVPLLADGCEFTIFPPRRGKLEYRRLAQNTENSQRIWVYSTLEADGKDWKEQYCFLETEFFPEDFEMMNYVTSKHPTTFFIQNVFAMTIVLANDKGNSQSNHESDCSIIGVLTLFNNVVRRRIGTEVEVLETLNNENDRVAALKKYFSIHLTGREQRAIRGYANELVDKTL
ncbi:hypothetical protein NLG97_g6152 [Lecanicillium saksenae]|uniref:Uncharacterized protein n=1 Tax=Lecanicillium saksenae TaxID=468837 RepID=A0ACC1QTK8_9HYPO|nr:hypothetical protein NLG97_g6152 [Lecanicillium saksenae]